MRPAPISRPVCPRRFAGSLWIPMTSSLSSRPRQRPPSENMAYVEARMLPGMKEICRCDSSANFSVLYRAGRPGGGEDW